jgi:hypothetical protein
LEKGDIEYRFVELLRSYGYPLSTTDFEALMAGPADIAMIPLGISNATKSRIYDYLSNNGMKKVIDAPISLDGLGLGLARRVLIVISPDFSPNPHIRARIEELLCSRAKVEIAAALVMEEPLGPDALKQALRVAWRRYVVNPPTNYAVANPAAHNLFVWNGRTECDATFERWLSAAAGSDIQRTAKVFLGAMTLLNVQKSACLPPTAQQLENVAINIPLQQSRCALLIERATREIYRKLELKAQGFTLDVGRLEFRDAHTFETALSMLLSRWSATVCDEASRLLDSLRDIESEYAQGVKDLLRGMPSELVKPLLGITLNLDATKLANSLRTQLDSPISTQTVHRVCEALSEAQKNGREQPNMRLIQGGVLGGAVGFAAATLLPALIWIRLAVTAGGALAGTVIASQQMGELTSLPLSKELDSLNLLTLNLTTQIEETVSNTAKLAGVQLVATTNALDAALRTVLDMQHQLSNNRHQTGSVELAAMRAELTTIAELDVRN